MYVHIVVCGLSNLTITDVMLVATNIGFTRFACTWVGLLDIYITIRRGYWNGGPGPYLDCLKVIQNLRYNLGTMSAQ